MNELVLNDMKAASKPASDIYVVNGTSGNDRGFAKLIDLMAEHGISFYQSPEKGNGRGQQGLVARDDTLVIKINSQWDQRGGTNTDLVKSVIQAIVEHPDGFVGEIVIADNGQAQYGAAGKGGNLDWEKNNAEDKSQSIQKVADSCCNLRVSTYLWDNITSTRGKEYSEGDLNDGYIAEGPPSSATGLIVSYPKFRTRFGTHISLKQGIWDPQTGRYDTQHLKLINMPVLKAHFIYGVTGCVKHYMGVVSDKLTAQLGARSHELVGRGGMGSSMVGTRFPVLNIIDAIWVNAKPAGGPWTPYDAATQANVILAGTDPVALDYWAAKNILLALARSQGHENVSVLDPDNTDSKSFGAWLRLAMKEIAQAGYQATVDESKMNVYVREPG